MRKFGYLLFVLLLSLAGHAQDRLGEGARISLLTSEPSDEEVFTVYGHAALRVFDAEQDLDLIFNYGIFDFSKPNFVYRFAKGETDYMLGATDFQSYIIEYQMRGSAVMEQVLNLSAIEKNSLWQALVENYKPQNREYRYNFLFDNCATRLAQLTEQSAEGEVTYNSPPAPKTFRELINYCTRNKPWLTFGCDLVLGQPMDSPATPHQMMFLPQYLRDEFAKVTITNPDGGSRPLIAETAILVEGDEAPEVVSDFPISPLTFSLLIFFCVVALSYVEWRTQKQFRILDCILFAVAGIAGVLVYFIGFASSHPHTLPNWTMVWLHPFALLAALLFSVKKCNKAAYCYHFINFAALTILLLGWYFIPQHLNIASLPLVATLWMRSGLGIYSVKGKPTR